MLGRSWLAGLVGLTALATPLFADATTCVPPHADWSKFPTGYQCIVGVQQFAMNEWGVSFPHTGGAPANAGCAALGACLEWVDDLPDKNVWNRYAWGSKDPQAYDILIFPPTSGNAYGHAAMFDHVEGSTVFVMDDNWDGNMNKSCAWKGQEGLVHDGIWAPYGFYRLKSLEPPPPDQAPKGSLDGAGCDAIAGWSQDPDEPDKPTGVDVYFDAMAAPMVPALGTLANVHRTDVGDHGFSLAPPIALFDGKPHQAFAYGIDTKAGAANTLLPGSPRAFSCAAPKPPFSPAIRRHIVDPPSLAAWKLSMLTQVAHYDDAQLAAIPAGADAPLTPKTAQADDGSPEVWLVDGSVRRHIVDAASLAAWQLDVKAIVKTPAAELKALTLGPDLPKAPFGVLGPTGAVYLLDAPPLLPGAVMGAAGGPSAKGGTGGATSLGAGGGSSSSVGGAVGGGAGPAAASGSGGAPSTPSSADAPSETESAGCAVMPGRSPSATWLFALALVGLRRRRR